MQKRVYFYLKFKFLCVGVTDNSQYPVVSQRGMYVVASVRDDWMSVGLD